MSHRTRWTSFTFLYYIGFIFLYFQNAKMKKAGPVISLANSVQHNRWSKISQIFRLCHAHAHIQTWAARLSISNTDCMRWNFSTTSKSVRPFTDFKWDIMQPKHCFAHFECENVSDRTDSSFSLKFVQQNSSILCVLDAFAMQAFTNGSWHKTVT